MGSSNAKDQCQPQAEPQMEPLAASSGLRGLPWIFSDTLVMTKRNLIRYVRVPQLIVFSAVQPIMFVLLFAYVFGGAIDTPGVEYIDFLIPGILVQAVLFGTSQATLGMAEDMSGGMVDRFRSLPMARLAVLAGRTLADTLRGFLTVLIMVGVGYLIGFRFQDGLLSAALAVVLVILFGFAFSWVSVFLGLLVKNSESAQVASFLVNFPLVFVSSAFVPVESMPNWLGAVAEVQPVSVAVDAVRALTLGGDTSNVWWTLVWIVGITAVFAPLAVIRYRRST